MMRRGASGSGFCCLLSQLLLPEAGLSLTVLSSSSFQKGNGVLVGVAGWHLGNGLSCWYAVSRGLRSKRISSLSERNVGLAFNIVGGIDGEW